MTSADLGVSAPADTRSICVGRIKRIASTDRLVWVALALIWILGHSFVGIENDARIYMGRALADLDPAGVGRDMMFELDGQSAFTVFRSMTRVLVATLGLGPTVGFLTIINLFAWFAAIACLARALVPGRAVLLVLLVALVLPRFYGPWHILAAAESVPIPRPLAEAGVLFALAAFLQDRMRLGLVALTVAALFHPIMAAPGFAILFVLLVRKDRRWLLAAAALIVAVAAATALGMPVVSRLAVVIDPEWRAVLIDRVPYLFPRLWPAETYGMFVVEAATIIIAARLVEQRAGLLFQCVVAIGVLGVLASLALGDGLSNLLVVQVQPWRALWLVAALAPVAAGICAWRLLECGRAGQIAAALLALAWVTMEWVPLGPIAATAALACLWLDRRGFVFGHRAVVAVAGACVVGIFIAEAVPVSALVAIMRARPTGVAVPWTIVWGTSIMLVPIVVLALGWWHVRHRTAAHIGGGVALALLAVLASLTWDSRSAFQASSDGGRHRADLQALLAARPGEVLWLRRDEGWLWLGRPNWTGNVQGAPIIFSRALAMKWRDRSSAAVAHGLAAAKLLRPRDASISDKLVDLTRADVTGFCRREDAPAWIVAPLEAGRLDPDVSGLSVWAPGGVDWSLSVEGGGIRWIGIDRFGIVPCGSRSGSRSSFHHTVETKARVT